MKIEYLNGKKGVKAVPAQQVAAGNYVAKKTGGCGCKNYGAKKIQR
ncbi:hypothetical protein ERJ70_00845 [Sediminibacillus dalangtanensis]|uniref:Uncharacterized protein n=1 Tax=Sediminibacillus dalangtanensis TaxID=2729421 RepID=A0ABX7VN45_9BACI|nr:hypothetical protein [Sediminibacillus dalangtanensis]QTM97996.1 hypothetical protein ERJ70_00845 [Sediminibacillus dalangtanensis]